MSIFVHIGAGNGHVFCKKCAVFCFFIEKKRCFCDFRWCNNEKSFKIIMPLYGYFSHLKKMQKIAFFFAICFTIPGAENENIWKNHEKMG